MGKPTGGTRPIALMPMLYRIWTKVRKPCIIQWESKWGGPWDAALQGSSALRSALLSLLRDEVHGLTHGNNITCLFDMEKFYDNIDITKLIKMAHTTSYPPLLLALGMQMHLALRGTRCFNIYPGAHLPCNGIIAWCTQSTTFAKVLLHEVLQQAYHNHQGVMIRSFVDDVRTSTYTPSHISPL